MKRTLYIILAGLMVFATSCVTKQKYLELEDNYKKCMNDKIDASNERDDLRRANQELDRKVAQLQGKVEQLAQDTLSLTRKLAQTESDYAKSRHDYDELAKDIANLTRNSNAAISELSGNLDSAQLQLSNKERELKALQEQLEAKQDSLNQYASSLAELQNVLDQKDKEVRALKEKVSNALKNFEGSGLKVEQRNGKVYVSMDEKLLFASARWEVQGEGKAALQELAKVLEADQDINVVIEGHTDNLAYNGSGQVRDNWDLSVMRATSVVKLLLSYGDIDPKRISASGRGEFFPIDPADTKEARAKNRRTEIILTPKLDELFQIIDNN
ncbi:MAG: OmpA family protein [Bacteroidales bacterium]|jgi:chemotaxis protein MotB|nr:OmpA family protein [Bacteroidales bacterium]MCR5114286.1 OmpA family protein [Bacteroidales bacterium]